MSSSLPSHRNSSEQEEDLSLMEQHRFINGRRFHNEQNTINYYFPNDSKESHRLDRQHYLYRYVWEGNYSSPMTKRLTEGNTSVLDIGCGPGIWILDMAQKYPQTSFVGIDVSSMFSPSNETPSNAIFLQHNVLEGLPWPPNTFDFVHKRFMSFSFTQNDLIKLIGETVRITNVNGWIEIMNHNLYSLKNCGKVTKKLLNAMIKFHESKNIKVPNSNDIINMLEDTGYITNIQYDEKSTPMGKCSGQMGEITMLNFKTRLNGLKVFLAPFMNLTIEQFDNLLNESEKECNDNQTYIYTYRIYGKKKSIEKS